MCLRFQLREGLFFGRLMHAYFFPNSRLVLAGDFNCYDSSLDKMGGNISVDSGLSDFKSSCSIRDAWRFKHPRERQFTWFNHDFSIASRLDTFFVSRVLCDSISECSILPCVYSDHDFVLLELDLTDPARSGPGVWKFNNSLLQDEAFCSEISDLIDACLSFRHVFSSTKEMWELLKKNFKSTSISFARDRRKELSRDKVFLTNRLIVLKRRLASGISAVLSEILELEASLKSIFDRELEGSKIRSRAKWLEEGEAPTGFFFNLENQRHEKSLISSVLIPEGDEVSSLPEMTEAHERFYSALFAEEEIDLDVQHELLSHVLSRLSDSDRESCEGLLSLDEATQALNLSNRNKTPGSDGLTVEFYSNFWSGLGPLLVDVFNESLSDGELCESMKSSVTRLVYKRDDRKDLKNWRPISLLNVDYKICFKAFSLRLARVLSSIISPDQTCSVPGRSIASNLALLRDTLDYIDRTGETGILVSLDQEKAFDRVNRSFLMTLLEHYGFGPSFCNCIRTLYNGAYMRILVNDFLSNPVPLHRGVRQGDAFSPMLYILCVEVLACNVRDSPDTMAFSCLGLGGSSLRSGNMRMIQQQLSRMTALLFRSSVQYPYMREAPEQS